MVLGLSTSEARKLLEEFGPNSVPEEKRNLALEFLKKLWGPVPWMLEVSLAIELAIGRYTQAIIIAFLLVFNAIISFIQESRAQNALLLLRNRLSIRVRVFRDGTWQMLPAEALVPGDVVHLRTGDLVPADLRLIEGNISVDLSSLTGETLPAELASGEQTYAGGIVKRGEADGEVTATGPKTYFGKTAELVHLAKPTSHLETIIVSIVKYLVALDLLLVAGVLVYSWIKAIPLTETLPFALIVLIASVPVALPATYTLASALGAKELSGRGVLVTRLSAIEEAASMDVLCSDKTGTITENRLTVAAVRAFSPHGEDEVIRLASLASAEASQDAIDLAILQEAGRRGASDTGARQLKFNPFDPATKRTEALVEMQGKKVRVVKGLPQVVEALTDGKADISQDVQSLASQGYRVLAVACGSTTALELAGLIGLQDPPRPDSGELIRQIEALGVRVVMVTGDGAETAQAVARQVGLGDGTCPAEVVRSGADAIPTDCKVIAGVLPEDKFQLVRMFQKEGHVTGMTGDGVNDAPALKQAEVGIAVSNATDVARAAASVVLTDPGLTDILNAVKIGRQVYQRMLTYTFNKIIKTFQIALFLGLGFFLTGAFVTTPLMILLLLFANDFVTMSISSDRVSYSPHPEKWEVRPLVANSLVLAIGWLLFAFGVYYLGEQFFHLPLEQLQSMVFVMLVFSGQANVYLVRERGHFWKSMPGRALLISSVADLLVVVFIATQGILIPAINVTIVAAVLALTIAYAVLLDLVKVKLFKTKTAE